MRDPVTGFEYPAEWAENCREPHKLQLVEGGLAVLTASGTVLLRGFTTGTTAAAACKAAVLSLNGSVDFVDLRLPCGLIVGVSAAGESGRASCKKFSGDYPGDATSGIEFLAEALPGGAGLTLIAGRGIGRFGRDTPRFRTGEPAISPTARECIENAIREAMECIGISGVTVTFSAPKGAEVARGTLNQKVGVKDGISVLGTTGFVEPWDDHLTESVIERIAAARDPVLTTGRIGLRYSRLLFPEKEAILVGGKIGEALAAASGDVILCGLPALILRYIDPDILAGTGFETVEELSGSPGFKALAVARLRRFRQKYPHIRIVLVNRKGAIIGESP